MIALLIIDMQEGSLAGSDKHDVPGVVARINALADKVRSVQGKVIFIQHDGSQDENLKPGTQEWKVLSSITQSVDDLYVSKTTNDPFYGSSLQDKLDGIGADQLIICGWATDQCVDSAVRSAISRDYEVIVASDCHTVSDRTIPAEKVIAHHNGIWTHLLTPGKPVSVMPANEIVESMATGKGTRG